MVCVIVLILIVIFVEHAMSSRPQVCLDEKLHQQKTETSLHRSVLRTAHITTTTLNDSSIQIHKQMIYKLQFIYSSFHQVIGWFACKFDTTRQCTPHRLQIRYLNVAVSSNGTTGNANGTTNGTTGQWQCVTGRTVEPFIFRCNFFVLGITHNWCDVTSLYHCMMQVFFIATT